MFLCSRDNDGDVILIENDWKCTLPGALKVGCIMAFHYGDSAILFIFPDIDVHFCFNVVYFPPSTFFIIPTLALCNVHSGFLAPREL